MNPHPVFGHARAARLRLLAAALLLATLLGPQAAAQTSNTDGATPPGLAPGAPAGSYALSGFENVNLFNGHLNFTLPLLKVGGRGGVGHTLPLRIEQKWRVELFAEPAPGAAPRYSPAGVWWGELDPGYGPGVLEARRGGAGRQVADCAPGAALYEYTLTRLTFTLPDGTEYELRDQRSGGRPALVPHCATTPYARGKVFVTADGSAATFISAAEIVDHNYAPLGRNGQFLPSGDLLLRDGTRYHVAEGLVRWVRDRNGNRLSFDYVNRRVATITDPLGRRVSLTYAGANGTPEDLITCAGFGGAARTIKVRRTNLGRVLRAGQAVRTYAALFPELLGASSHSHFDPGRVAGVELPDGRHYAFRYNSYGELARVELPTGGAVEYDWTPESGALHDYGSQIYRRVVERRVYGDRHSATPESRTVYGAGGVVEVWDGGGTLLARSVHSFHGDPIPQPDETGLGPVSYARWDAGREYQTEVFEVQDGRPVLRRRVNHKWQQRAAVSWWNSQSLMPEPANDPRLVETVTALTDTGQVSRQTFDYDRFNNQTGVWESDFGPGQPGPLLRHSRTEYVEEAGYVNSPADAVPGVHLRSLPSHARVFADAGPSHPVSLTTYEYDHYAADARHQPLVPRAGITGHDPAYHASFALRGNVTGVTAYADAAAAAEPVTVSTQYDVAGNVVKSVDARGQESEFSYGDAFCNDGVRCGGTATADTFAFLVSAKSPVPDPSGTYGSRTALVTSTVYDFWTGLASATTDANHQTTRFEYDDPLDRPTGVVRPDGGRTDFVYSPPGEPPHVRTLSDLDAARRTEARQEFDGLGRAVRSFVWEGQEAARPWLTSDTEYDALGRVRRTSSPYRSAGPGSGLNPSGHWTTTGYDALGRVTSVRTPDDAARDHLPAGHPDRQGPFAGDAQVHTAYDGDRVLVTDQAGKRRMSRADALGRLTDVWEITPADAATVPVTFQGATYAGYHTAYQYDALGHLRRVAQGGQVRSFAYDALGRLVRARQPEQGVMTDDPPGGDFPALTDASSGMSNSRWSVGYRYDAGGNLTKRKDARDVTATYTYDALNRNTTIEYSDATPDVARSYDGAQLGQGRAWKSEAAGTARTIIAEYDALGRPRAYSQQFWDNAGWGASFEVTRAYDLAGNVISQTYPSGRTVTSAHDAAGRLASFSGNLGDSVSRTYSTGIIYDESGSLSREQFGTQMPLFNKRRYTARGQLYEVRLGTGPDPESWNRGLLANHYSAAAWAEWGASGPDNNGNLLRSHYYLPQTDQSSLGDPAASTLFYQDYEYDALNRLTRVTESSNLSAAPSYAQAYDYDRWGNRTLNAAGTWEGHPAAPPSGNVPEPEFDTRGLAASNRLHAPGDLNAGRDEAQRRMRYDGAGNLTQDLCHDAATLCARAYDAEGRMTAAQVLSGQVRTARYAYDADGRRVKRETVDDGEVWQIYGLDAELLAEYAPHASASQPRREYGYRGGELLVSFEAPPAAQARANFALTANGATAAASSTLDGGRPPAGAIDGDRAGHYWGSGGGWHDATPDAYPDWLEVTFAGEQTVDEVHVFSVQDTYWSPEEPAEATAFTQYGLTDFDVEYWTGAAWQAVPGGRVRGNQRVWRRVRFAPVTTGKLRVVVQAAQAGYSRIAELEAWGPQGQTPPHLNVASAAAGARATTSSTLDGGRAAAGAINGERAGRDWGAGGGWHDATPEEFPDWLEVSFAGPRAVGEVSVFSVQDEFLWPEEPDEQTAFTRYGVTDFDVQYWDGAGWVTVASVTGNRQVWRRVRFAQVVTTKLRVVVRGALAGYSRIAEVEAYAAAPAARVRWVVADHLGTPRMVVDETGSLAGVTRHDYSPFGEELGAGVGGRTTAQGYSQPDGVRQKWVGEEYDAETGLSYFGARYMSSTQGRFTSVDPYNIILESQATADINPERAQAQFLNYLLYPQQWNRYAYAVNNPLRYIDPTGEKIELTGSERDREIGFQRIKDMVGEKAAKLLYVREENGRFYVDYRGKPGDGDRLAATGDFGVFIANMIDSDKTTEFRVATSFDTKDRRGLSVASFGGGATVGSEESLTGNTQIFVHPDAGNVTTMKFGATMLGRSKSSNGRQLDYENDIVDAHEFGHAYGNMIEGQPLKNSNATDRRAVQLENYIRQRRGLNTRTRH